MTVATRTSTATKAPARSTRRSAGPGLLRPGERVVRTAPCRQLTGAGGRTRDVAPLGRECEAHFIERRDPVDAPVDIEVRHAGDVVTAPVRVGVPRDGRQQRTRGGDADDPVTEPALRSV